ncbi:hypothetical protein J0H58_24710 [bacterium]|nr:hypothetical protein [bacterium]
MPRDRDGYEPDDEPRRVTATGGVPVWVWALAAAGTLGVVSCGGVGVMWFLAAERNRDQLVQADLQDRVQAAAREKAAVKGEAAAGRANPAIDRPSVSDWSTVGDVKVRVLKAEVRKPVLVDIIGGGGAREGSQPELLLWVETANASADKKLVFAPWGAPNVTLTDDKGNRYRLLDEPGERGLKENDPVLPGLSLPSAPPLVWVYRFERPASAATRLRLSAVSPVVFPSPVQHDLRIPASAWSK